MANNRELSQFANTIGYNGGNIGIGTDNPGDKLSILAAPNSLVFGTKDTTRGNHIFQLLANNPAGDGELRLYKSSASGTHEKTVEIKSTGNSYFNGGRLLIGTNTARAIGGESNSRLHIEGSGGSSNSWVNISRFANNTGAASIQFGKSRSDTPGTYTVVQNNDTLGSINFAGADGTDLASYGAKIAAEVDGTPGSNDMPGRLTFFTTSDGSASPTERLRITAAGNLGIGNDGSFPMYTGTNDRTLILGTGSEDSAIQIHSGTSNYGGLYFGDGTSGTNRYRGYVEFKHGTGDEFLRFGTAATERLRITSAGKIGIGVASPDEMMEITNTAGTGCQIQLRDTSTGSAAGDGFRVGYNGSGGQLWNFENTYIRFATNNTERLKITSTGTSEFTSDSSTVCAKFTGNGVYVNHAIGSEIFLGTQSGSDGKIGTTNNSNLHLFANGYGNRITVNTSGSLSLPDGDLIVANGHGINFGSTTPDGTTPSSELLDDYEEGTFTPTIDVSGTSGSLSIGYSNQVGRYVKVGRIVHFTIDIRLSSWSRGTGTGGIMVLGLPFDPVDSNNYSRATGFCNLYNWNYSSDSADIPVWSIYQDAGHPWVNITKHRKGNTSADISDPGSNSMLFFSGTYEAGA